MRRFSTHMAVVLAMAVFFSACKKTDVSVSQTASQGNEALALRKASLSKKGGSQLAASTRVFAGGLNNPRGLKFGPDGYLYVAEGGTGGTNSTEGQCEQVPFPVGPYHGSLTGGRISKIDAAGMRTTVTDQLPRCGLYQ